MVRRWLRRLTGPFSRRVLLILALVAAWLVWLARLSGGAGGLTTTDRATGSRGDCK
jgi:uncharacterized membrane protein